MEKTIELKRLGKVKIQVLYKDIKNINLRVYRDFSIKLSLPMNVADEWINKFLESKKDWIESKLEMYKATDGYNNLLALKSGSSTQMLGKDMRIIKVQSTKNFVEVDEKKILVNLKDINNNDSFMRVFSNWWREQAFNVYSQQVDALYNSVFKKYGVQKPTISIKKMKTMWGSCTKSLGKITLNEYLLKADIMCIQYVVLHELTHLIYTYHSKDFYDFLTIHMPDWQSRKKQLDMEVVQGL